MLARRRLRDALREKFDSKANKPELYKGELGAIINGAQVVAVEGRPSYVWVRLRGQQSELIRAYNDVVGLIYGLRVEVEKIEGHYRIYGRDQTESMGTSPGASVGPHGYTHRFKTGNDVSWVDKQQFMAMVPHPNSPADEGLYIESDFYGWGNTAKYWPGTGTVSLVALRPSGTNQGRFMTVYLDSLGNPTYLTGSIFSLPNGSLYDAEQYIPFPSLGSAIPIAAVLLLSGTSTIDWRLYNGAQQIWDLRLILNGPASSLGDLPPQITVFTLEGALSVASGTLRLYNASGESRTISKVFIAVDTAPTGSGITVDIHKNGTTIFTTQSNRPSIAAAANTGQTTTIEVPTWADGEYLTLDIDAVGSTIPGYNLSAHVVWS